MTESTEGSTSVADTEGPPLLDRLPDLERVLVALQAQDRIALDTEADSLHSYFEKLCLLQISVQGHDFLIDPLADLPLGRLFAVFDGRELVLHGADYDLRLLRRCGCPMPTRLFDTMIAARLCGLTEFSLAALLKRYFDLEIPKSSQKADWGRRPLPLQMRAYAVNDSRYLLRLADIFGEELARLNRTVWFQQSCERAVATSSVDRERDPDQLWRLSGSHDLSLRASAVLRALWRWRDNEARTVDRPAFHILHNERMIVAAEQFDKGERVEIPHLRGSRQKRFFEAAEAALALPESEWPKFERKPRPKSTPDWDVRFRAIKQKRDAISAELRLDPSIIAPKATLERWAAAPEETAAGMMPWQRELLSI